MLSPRDRFIKYAAFLPPGIPMAFPRLFRRFRTSDLSARKREAQHHPVFDPHQRQPFLPTQVRSSSSSVLPRQGRYLLFQPILVAVALPAGLTTETLVNRALLAPFKAFRVISSANHVSQEHSRAHITTCCRTVQELPVPIAHSLNFKTSLVKHRIRYALQLRFPFPSHMGQI